MNKIYKTTYLSLLLIICTINFSSLKNIQRIASKEKNPVNAITSFSFKNGSTLEITSLLRCLNKKNKNYPPK